MRNFAIAAAGAAVLASCSTSPQVPASLQSQHKLQQELAGRVAGAPMGCIPRHQARDMIVVDDNTILFKRGSVIYRNDPPGGCNGLGGGFNTLVTRSSGSGTCSGDIATVSNTTTGTVVGSCSLGEFVPYTRAGG